MFSAIASKISKQNYSYHLENSILDTYSTEELEEGLLLAAS
jgi:hypothetical protein